MSSNKSKGGAAAASGSGSSTGRMQIAPGAQIPPELQAQFAAALRAHQATHGGSANASASASGANNAWNAPKTAASAPKGAWGAKRSTSLLCKLRATAGEEPKPADIAARKKAQLAKFVSIAAASEDQVHPKMVYKRRWGDADGALTIPKRAVLGQSLRVVLSLAVHSNGRILLVRGDENGGGEHEDLKEDLPPAAGDEEQHVWSRFSGWNVPQTELESALGSGIKSSSWSEMAVSGLYDRSDVSSALSQAVASAAVPSGSGELVQPSSLLSVEFLASLKVNFLRLGLGFDGSHLDSSALVSSSSAAWVPLPLLMRQLSGEDSQGSPAVQLGDHSAVRSLVQGIVHDRFISMPLSGPRIAFPYHLVELAILHKDKVLLIKHGDQEESTEWGLPLTHVEPGEDLAFAGSRLARAMFGYVIDIHGVAAVAGGSGVGCAGKDGCSFDGVLFTLYAVVSSETIPSDPEFKEDHGLQSQFMSVEDISKLPVAPEEESSAAASPEDPLDVSFRPGLRHVLIKLMEPVPSTNNGGGGGGGGDPDDHTTKSKQGVPRVRGIPLLQVNAFGMSGAAHAEGEVPKAASE